MGVMTSTTWYLPAEELHYRNYPEVSYALADINSIMSYGLTVATAISNYTNGVADKINVDTHDLISCINLCRNVCNTLSIAPNICYDILLELRAIQNALQTILYVSNRFGSTYVSTTTLT